MFEDHVVNFYLRNVLTKIGYRVALRCVLLNYYYFFDFFSLFIVVRCWRHLFLIFRLNHEGDLIDLVVTRARPLDGFLRLRDFQFDSIMLGAVLQFFFFFFEVPVGDLVLDAGTARVARPLLLHQGYVAAIVGNCLDVFVPLRVLVLRVPFGDCWIDLLVNDSRHDVGGKPGEPLLRDLLA